jgi:hypothetical protein
VVKPLAVFIASAMLSAVIQVTLASCANDDDSCGCPDIPAQPEQKSALPITQVDSFDDIHNREELPFDLSEGTVEITGQQLLVHYAVEGVDREVAYDITPVNRASAR